MKKRETAKWDKEPSNAPVEDSGAGDGEGHHHNQVSQEGEGAEHQVGAGPKPGLDYL